MRTGGQEMGASAAHKKKTGVDVGTQKNKKDGKIETIAKQSMLISVAISMSIGIYSCIQN